MAKTIKKEQAKFKARGYRFSKKTQNLLNKLTKRTRKSQNDVVRKALEHYESFLAVEPEFNVAKSKTLDTGLPAPGTKEHAEGMLAGLDAMQLRNKMME